MGYFVPGSVFNYEIELLLFRDQSKSYALVSENVFRYLRAAWSVLTVKRLA